MSLHKIKERFIGRVEKGIPLPKRKLNGHKCTFGTTKYPLTSMKKIGDSFPVKKTAGNAKSVNGLKNSMHGLVKKLIKAGKLPKGFKLTSRDSKKELRFWRIK